MANRCFETIERYTPKKIFIISRLLISKEEFEIYAEKIFIKKEKKK